MPRQYITDKNIGEYERQCANLSHDMEQIALRLRALDEEWVLASRPNPVLLGDVVADFLTLTASRIRAGAGLERSFIEEQRDVRRVRGEQKNEA